MAAHARAGDLEGAVKLGLLDCIACGSCSYVCPAHIPLVQYFNYAKGEMAARGRAKQKQTETRRLAEHALQYGLDPEHGGVYRDGPHTGPALVRDKEWWQNSEALVGWLDAYEQFADPRFAAAFLGNWEFDRKFFIHPQLGEWRQLLARDGSVLVGDLGNPWKACYHSGRSVLECVERLDRLLAR
jgi:mannose/cellobiose epimerase-like protein (N-acyl-D-glucosamine 2-epimerase family)